MATIKIPTTDMFKDVILIGGNVKGVKSEINVGDEVTIRTQTKFNKLQKYMIKKFFNFEVRDIRNE